MKYLLSLPPNLVRHFHVLTGVDAKQWFCTADPADSRLGSGGGTAWLLQQCAVSEGEKGVSARWLAGDRRVLVHAGGCGRRIPAYAPSGKVLTPIPSPLGEDNGHSCRTLLDMQMPLYRRVLEQAPEGVHTLIASGDVFIDAPHISCVPEADVVCFGMQQDVALAQNHGVFMMRRESPDMLDYMLQKPSVAKLTELSATHHFLMDIGLWLLSDKAVERLMAMASDGEGNIVEYDLYGAYGLALGANPTAPEPRLEGLSVKVVDIEGGRFLHYGTSRELISSTAALQERKPCFTLNSVVDMDGREAVDDLWIENSCVPETWTLGGRNIITGVPDNRWRIELGEGQCVDIVPVGESEMVLRPYGFNDKFSGSLCDEATMFLEQPVGDWMAWRGINLNDFSHTGDIQDAELFPVVNDADDVERLLQWFIAAAPDITLTAMWRNCRRISANRISDEANLPRLIKQRKQQHLQSFVADMRCAMMRSERQVRGENGGPDEHSERAFAMLRGGLLDGAFCGRSFPRCAVLKDQIVCAQSPARADVAGGWTDTPPYSVYGGGSVVNFAFNINGQSPLHAYVRPCKDYHIVCSSIDQGASEVITSFEQLRMFSNVGSAFSIPKAALALVGFLPEYCAESYSSLHQQLEDMGCGLEITMLSAAPAGSGLGTSSILAATVLAALAEFCSLNWDKDEICRRTLALEQLLTTGGGWQDQYGGVFGGIKHLVGNIGLEQQVSIVPLPDILFGDDQKACHLMYYTGITRVAKHILKEIVKGMFRQDEETLAILREMGQHAAEMASVIARGDFDAYGRLIRRSWEFNCRLDSGTAPDSVQALCHEIDDLCLGYKLLGAGGGGYMYMVAKDVEAATRLRHLLADNPLRPTARFVEMDISDHGLCVSRS